MQYRIDYQFFAKGESRPSDDGEIMGIEATDATGTVILPNVGDYVQIDNSLDGGERSSLSGKVRSRLFRFIRTIDDVSCQIKIVFEENDAGWDKLIKE